MSLPPKRAAVRLAAALATAFVVAACSSGPPAPPSMTLTFVRHAESDANASGITDTAVPGPPITPAGLQQAQRIANTLQNKKFDGIFASSMVRTQQTAAPLAGDIGKQVQVLPGLDEIGAGRFEGTPESRASSTYFLAPTSWLSGDRTARIPGGVDGNEFNDQFTAAVRKMYDSGDRNAVAFSHAASIMVWTLMNVQNPQDSLLSDHPLPNTGEIVVRGNPVTGWTLVSWDGLQQSG